MGTLTNAAIISTIGLVCTCATTVAMPAFAAEREYGDDAPSLAFKGPLAPLPLSPAQIKLVKKAIADSLADPASASFGRSYRAGKSDQEELVVCGYVNGKSFVGMFATPQGGSIEFLPIRVAQTEEEQPSVREYCRAKGIYVPE
jgi:hypothetical protein